MKRKHFRIVNLILICAATLSASLACHTFRNSTEQTSAAQPPIAQPNPSPRALETPTVSYCELIRNPQRYNEKLVRVHAHYRVGFEVSYLYDLECVKDKTPVEKARAQQETWLNFDHAHESCWRSAMAKLHEARGRRGATAEVTLVGKFSELKNLQGPRPDGKYQFVAQCLERVKITAYSSRLIGDEELPSQ